MRKKPTHRPEIERDPLTELVIANLRDILEDQEKGERALQALGGPKVVYDLLNGRAKSLRVDTLGAFAKALDVPAALFFLPPDKRETLANLLGTLGKLSPHLVRQVEEIAKVLERTQPPS